MPISRTRSSLIRSSSSPFFHMMYHSEWSMPCIVTLKLSPPTRRALPKMSRPTQVTRAGAPAVTMSRPRCSSPWPTTVDDADDVLVVPLHAHEHDGEVVAGLRLVVEEDVLRLDLDGEVVAGDAARDAVALRRDTRQVGP